MSALAGRKRTRGPIKVLALEVGKNIEISGDRGEQLALVLTQPGDERSLPLWRVDPDKTSPEICEKLCVEDETTPVKIAGVSAEKNDRVSVDLRTDPGVVRAEIIRERHLLVRFIDRGRGCWCQVSLFRVSDAVVS